MILPPMQPEPYEDRASDCEMAVEMKVHELVDQVVAVGWNRKEAMAAIANVILNEMFALQENEQTNVRLAEALGKVEH
ncbi:hypothetical protein [Rhizobium sp. RAF56]|jgi:hypothetical protein|uniref:hypothetical protein n=1 Tax=Rhizobium sp. RAF56 TaxID=3233062 RepID=UPI003F99E774